MYVNKITHGFTPGFIFSACNVLLLIMLFSSKVKANLTWTLDLDNFLAESSNVLHNGTHGNDIVYVGGVEMSNNQTLLYGVDITGSEVPDIQSQLAAGVQAIRDSTADEIKAYSYHFSNGHLSTRKFRRTPDPEEKKDGKLTVVVKCGAHQVGTAITQFVSEIVSATVQQWIGSILNGDKGGTECMERTEIIPIGSNWARAAGCINLATCATHGKKCDSTISDSSLEAGTQWANNAIDNYPYRDSWKVGFSHGGSWHLCIRIANKSYYLTYEKARKVVSAMGCPKGFCDGGAFTRLPHDEL